MRRGGGYRRAFYSRAFSLDRGWGQSGRSGLLPPGGLHQLCDGTTNGPASVHYFAVQTNGVPRFPHLVTDKNTRSKMWTSRPLQEVVPNFSRPITERRTNLSNLQEILLQRHAFGSAPYRRHLQHRGDAPHAAHAVRLHWSRLHGDPEVAGASLLVVRHIQHPPRGGVCLRLRVGVGQVGVGRRDGGTRALWRRRGRPFFLLA